MEVARTFLDVYRLLCRPMEAFDAYLAIPPYLSVLQ